MTQNMVLIMECPDCIEKTGFSTGKPKRGDAFFCPNCGEMFVVRAKWLNELNGIMDEIHDSIDRFVVAQE